MYSNLSNFQIIKISRIEVHEGINRTNTP